MCNVNGRARPKATFVTTCAGRRFPWPATGTCFSRMMVRTWSTTAFCSSLRSLAFTQVIAASASVFGPLCGMR